MSEAPSGLPWGPPLRVDGTFVWRRHDEKRRKLHNVNTMPDEYQGLESPTRHGVGARRCAPTRASSGCHVNRVVQGAEIETMKVGSKKT